jgi:phosphatidylserine/phosphatidylglycerophosphate/cardiolipin synthase-like enzyme
LEEKYFYQNIKESEWDEIKNFLNDYLSNNKTDISTLENFFINFPNMYKGSHNTDKLKEMINEIAKTYQNNFASYQTLINFFINTYLNTKPALLECYFFPNQNNERKVVDMFRTCKKTLDLAIFTLTKDSISNAIEEAYKRGVKVRLIADDSCSLMLGSDVRKLAAIGVPTKTDRAKYYMHNKVAIIDKSVLVTGSYNWSRQATNYNQENILFFENKDLCEKYTQEYDK